MFVRFVVGHAGEYHKELTGIVTEARLLRDRGELLSYEEDCLDSIYDWFNEYLPCPPFSDNKWTEGVCWFKDNAEVMIKQMWSLVVLLEEHGKPVRILRSENPGKVLYEDRYQVVVKEWKHL